MSVGLPGSTNVGEQLPTGQLSVVPWRRTGVKYTNNEAYFDVVEEIDAIIDKSGIPLDHLFATGSALACFATFAGFDLHLSCPGSTITAEIQGVIDACVKLTGMPDLTLSFMVSLLFLRACLFGGQTVRLSPRILGCWTMSVSTRVSGSSAGKQSGSSPSYPPMETSACCPTTSALRSQSLSDPTGFQLSVNAHLILTCGFLTGFKPGGHSCVRQAQHHLPRGELTGPF